MESVGLYNGSVVLYSEECWVTWWGVVLHGGLLGYIMRIVGLYGESIGLHGGMLGYIMRIVGLYGESVGLHGGMFGYMVRCWVM